VSLLWISRWLDYTAKYGLSYQLSDGSMGIIFNDNTRMLLAPHKEYDNGTHIVNQTVLFHRLKLPSVSFP
jgi:hypothetical protein